MERVWNVTEHLTKDKIEKWDEDDGIFYRWQNPDYAIEGEFTESWGMVFSSKEEALKDSLDYGIEPEDAILPGKSCMPTLEEIYSYITEFADSAVLLVFNGVDTYAEGHDGEYVAEYVSSVAVLDQQEVINFFKENYED